MKLTPIHVATLNFVANRRSDPMTGRILNVDLRDVSEGMRQRIIDLAMADRPLVDVDGPRVFVTAHGQRALHHLASGKQDR